MKRISYLILISIFLFSCEDTTGNADEISGIFKNLERGGDVSLEYTYFDLDEDKIISTTTPDQDSKWDIGFGRAYFGMADDGQGGQYPDYRSVIVLNSGVSGSNTVEGYLLMDTTFDEIAEIPQDIDSKLETDTIDNGIIVPALKTGSGTWYNYDFITHKLVANPSAIMIIKSSTGVFFKMSMISLYKLDKNDIPNYEEYGYFTFRYEQLN